MSELLNHLKSLSIKFEECRWINLNEKEQIQIAMIFLPESKSKILNLLESRANKLKNKNIVFEDGDPKQRFHFDPMLWRNITLSSKRSYKSFTAKLDAPSQERLNLLKVRLKKTQESELPGTPSALVEQQIQNESKRTLRSIIVSSIEKQNSKGYESFLERIKDAKECLVTNYHRSHESLWASLRPLEGKSQQVRLSTGVSIFFSHQDSTREGGKVAKIVEKGLANGWVFKDWVLF